MDANLEYRRWLSLVKEEELLADLRSIGEDEREILDRFHQPLSFGTAGMRGVLAMGTNRMNRYTVGRATQGLSDYLNEITENGTIVITNDNPLIHKYLSP